jgi:hypothetical protein
LQLHYNKEEMKEVVASVLAKNPSKFISMTALGQMERERLKTDGLIINVAILDNEEVFWTKEIQDQANGITNEVVISTFIAPFFNNLLASSGMVFVNSERYQWLISLHLCPSHRSHTG